jgi:hypothetical protein
MTRIWNALARIPNPVVAAMLVVGGALVSVHELWLAHVRATSSPEPEQWLAYLTIKWYWALLPLAFLALWARRREATGAVGRIGAWLLVVGGPLEFLVLLVATQIWGLLLGRGDLPLAVMNVEWLTLLITPGAVLVGIAMLLDRAVPKWLGGLVIALALAAWLPYGAVAVGLVLGGMLLTKGRHSAEMLDSRVPAHAR